MGEIRRLPLTQTSSYRIVNIKMRKSLFSLFMGAKLALSTSIYPVKLETRGDLTSHVANIHLTFTETIDEVLTFTFGSCTAQNLHEAHHVIGESEDVDFSRLVWIIPRNADPEGCISAWTNSGTLVGRSEPQRLHNVKRKASQKRDDCMSRSHHTLLHLIGSRQYCDD